MIEVTFYENRIKTLRVYKTDGESCHCGKPDCSRQGKHPCEKNGVHSADLHRDMSYFDGYNIGVACGNGLVVVDIDQRNGGYDTLRGLIHKHGPLPKTWTVYTGNGLHYYFDSKNNQADNQRVG